MTARKTYTVQGTHDVRVCAIGRKTESDSEREGAESERERERVSECVCPPGKIVCLPMHSEFFNCNRVWRVLGVRAFVRIFAAVRSTK